MNKEIPEMQLSIPARIASSIIMPFAVIIAAGVAIPALVIFSLVTWENQFSKEVNALLYILGSVIGFGALSGCIAMFVIETEKKFVAFCVAYFVSIFMLCSIKTFQEIVRSFSKKNNNENK
jgi:predicted permease